MWLCFLFYKKWGIFIALHAHRVPDNQIIVCHPKNKYNLKLSNHQQSESKCAVSDHRYEINKMTKQKIQWSKIISSNICSDNYKQAGWNEKLQNDSYELNI